MSEPRERARALLAAALGIDPHEVDPHAGIGVQEGWDSLAHLRLALALEEARGRPLSSDEVLSLESLEDVARVLAASSPR